MDKGLVNMYLNVNRYFNDNPKFLARSAISNGAIQKVKGLSMRPVDMSSPLVSLKAEEAVNSIWCADGLHWNDRVWKNMELLQQSLEQGIIDTITRGVSPTKTAVKIAKEQ